MIASPIDTPWVIRMRRHHSAPAKQINLYQTISLHCLRTLQFAAQINEYHPFTSKISHPSYQELELSINEALEWLDDSPDADTDQFQARRKEVEQIANPIMSRLYNENQGTGATGGGGGEDYDFGDDEL